MKNIVQVILSSSPPTHNDKHKQCQKFNLRDAAEARIPVCQKPILPQQQARPQMESFPLFVCRLSLSSNGHEWQTDCKSPWRQL